MKKHLLTVLASAVLAVSGAYACVGGPAESNGMADQGAAGAMARAIDESLLEHLHLTPQQRPLFDMYSRARMQYVAHFNRQSAEEPLCAKAPPMMMGPRLELKYRRVQAEADALRSLLDARVALVNALDAQQKAMVEMVESINLPLGRMPTCPFAKAKRPHHPPMDGVASLPPKLDKPCFKRAKDGTPRAIPKPVLPGPDAPKLLPVPSAGSCECKR